MEAFDCTEGTRRGGDSRKELFSFLRWSQVPQFTRQQLMAARGLFLSSNCSSVHTTMVAGKQGGE